MEMVAKGEAEIGLTFLSEMENPGLDAVVRCRARFPRRPLWWVSCQRTRRTPQRRKHCWIICLHPKRHRSTRHWQCSRATNRPGKCGRNAPDPRDRRGTRCLPNEASCAAPCPLPRAGEFFRPHRAHDARVPVCCRLLPARSAQTTWRAAPHVRWQPPLRRK